MTLQQIIAAIAAFFVVIVIGNILQRRDAQFRQGLRRCFRLPITEPQMSALVEKYSLRGVVKYVEFVQGISFGMKSVKIIGKKRRPSLPAVERIMSATKP